MTGMTLSTATIIVTGVLLNAVAQLLLKIGVTPLGPLSVGVDNALPTTLRVLSQWPVLGGLACYVVSVGVWIVGLSRVDVSVAYPMLSLGYVVNAVAAWWLLGEPVGAMRSAGVLLILGGVWLVARS
jgi:multidrug transporter EmrE-like cation transporter